MAQPKIAEVSSLPMVSSQGQDATLIIAPQNFTEVMQFADMMAKSSFVPRHLRNKPADCLAVCLQALRWGMDCYGVAQKTYFVSEGAAPGYEAQLVNAVVYSRAPLEGRLDIQWSGEWPKRVCTVTGRIRNDPSPKVRVVQAVTITTRNSPLWKADPDQQLAYYATRAWARLYCPDVLMGVYTPDEIRDGLHIGPENARDVTPPATKMDALEELIDGPEGGADEAEDPEPEPDAEAPTGPTPDPQPEPNDWPAFAQELGEQIDGCESVAFVQSFWKERKPDLDAMKAGAPETYATLHKRAQDRMAELKKPR